MKEYKCFTFDEIKDYILLSQKAWERVQSVPGEEYVQALRREFTWPEGFLEGLRGKTLEQQMDCYRIVETRTHIRRSYGEITHENSHEFGYALREYPGLLALVVEDGILLGVCIKGFYTRNRPWGVPAFPYRDICTYSASDNNGSGTKDRTDYAYLCCVAPDPEA